MLVLGIIGSSGAGKSTVCKIIKKYYNIEIIDADIIAKELQDKKTIYYKKIVETFGKDILFSDGFINRKKLAEIIFSSQLEKEKLDKLTFKYVIDEIKIRIENLKAKNIDYIIVDAPTLIESNNFEICDKIIAVISKKENKINRICERDNISKEMAEKRLMSQMEDEFYKRYADFVITNDDENLENKVKKVLEEIK